MTPTIRRAQDADHESMVAVWRSAVDATHAFVAEEHLAEIEAALATEYFPHVELLVAEVDDRVVGFAGAADGNLEMLFVHATMRGSGIGRALLTAAIDLLGVEAVDVNEQNEGATGFYRHQGFVVEGRSELDGQGRPYPLLHMKLAESAGARRDGHRTVHS